MRKSSFIDYFTEHAGDVPLLFYVASYVAATYIFTEMTTTQNKYVFLALSMYITELVYRWLL